jgi:hypothetical protein
MPGLLNDIPSSDGTNVFIRQMKVLEGSGSGGRHLFSSGGFRDSTWFNRTFWQVGRAKTTGQIVLGNEVAYGIEVYPASGRDTLFRAGANSYRLTCIPLRVAPADRRSAPQVQKKRRATAPGLWQQRLPMRVTAMVRAGGTVFVAGPPDIVDPDDPHAAWEGRCGGILAAYNAEDGEKHFECRLASPPVWDGMAAAKRRVYVATVDRRILCFEGR